MNGKNTFVLLLLLIGGNILLGVSSLDSCNSSSKEQDTPPQDASSYHVLKMVEWLRSIRGGYLSPKVQIRRADPSDPNSYFGFFANHDLERDELLLNIPPEVRLESDSSAEDYTAVLCDLAWTLKREFDLDYRSDHVHYINYLKEQRRDIIPAVWSQAGKDLLLQVQGWIYMTDYDLGSAESDHMVNWIDDWFLESCMMNEDGNECLDPYFVAVVTQRGFDSMLAPIYDMINHHNGKVNTFNRRSIYHRDGFDIYASQRIAAGEELFFSYYNCPDCRGCADCPVTQTHWGTPEMLRDFGFVEPYPHYWYLGDFMTFVIHQDDNDDDTTSLRIEFLNGRYPNDDIVDEAKKELARLEDVYERDLVPSANNTKVAKHEYYTISQYHKALTTAFTLLVDAYESGKTPKPLDDLEAR